jgi:3-hydroxyisobutyrate dehydrogenase-like beta-hydroxyacid dehydrogenase
VADSDPTHGGDLRVVATTVNEADAELVAQRLAQAGIQAISQRVTGGPEMGASGARYVYVAAAELERAREVLAPLGPAP